jgi:hypothetical protein
MELTKNQFVMKALVEEMLRRNYHTSEPNQKSDIETGLVVLNALLPSKIYVISTAPRIVDDFARALKRPRNGVIHLAYADQAFGHLCGRENAHIVQLHTGMLAIDQSEIRKNIMDVIRSRCRNAVIWHVGEWRV